jgi:hypothetical protein
MRPPQRGSPHSSSGNVLRDGAANAQPNSWVRRRRCWRTTTHQRGERTVFSTRRRRRRRAAAGERIATCSQRWVTSRV